MPEPHAPTPAGGPTGAPAIELVDVVKRFGATTVLDGLSFAVAKGERVALIGPSGSGKTTSCACS